MSDTIREQVRERDGRRCVDCGMTSEQSVEVYGKELDVHRLVRGSAYTLAGCVTVCRSCHSKRHQKPATKKAVKVTLATAFHDRLREAARLVGAGATVSGIVEGGAAEEVARLEAEHNGGRPFADADPGYKPPRSPKKGRPPTADLVMRMNADLHGRLSRAACWQKTTISAIALAGAARVVNDLVSLA